MDRPDAPVIWREYFGLFLAVVAGLLLILIGVRINDASKEAGLDVATLSKERAGINYAKHVHAAMTAVQHFRRVVTLNDPADGSWLAARDGVERALRDGSEFNAGEGAIVKVSDRWNSVLRDWKRARPHKQSDGVAENRVVHDLFLTYAQLEDNSNLTYDSNLDAQNIADIVINKNPGAIDDVGHVTISALRFIGTHGITLRRRMTLASRLSGMSYDFDYSTDYLPKTLDAEARLDPAVAAVENAVLTNAALSTKQGTALIKLLNDHVLMESYPTVSPTEIKRQRDALLKTLGTLNTDITGILMANVERRIALEQSRRTLLEIGAVVAILFLWGMVLEVARFTARRDRQELRRAHEESSRLAAELAREHAEKTLALTEAQFRAVFDGAAIGIAILDQRGTLVDANSVFRQHFGRDASLFLDGHKDELAQILSGRRQLFEFEQHYAPEDRDEVWVDATVSVVSDGENHPQFAMCMFRDITDIKHNERRIVHDMTHDTLTGLPNRVLFEAQLRERFAESSTLLDSFFAVLFVDLDHFKDFNESLGHGAGDLVLQQVATRLRASLDPADLVSRLGSDEFAVLIRSLGDILHVESVARRILTNVCKPIQIGERAVFAACSIGIAIGSANYERAEDVMRDANTAMSQAKSGGGSRYAVFDSNMHARAERRLQLTTDLRLALQRNEFRLLYQPIVRVADAQLVGCEALLRWDHPTEGLILPGDFMSLSEQTGIAIPIGRFVIETACRQLSKWRENWRGAPQPPFTMSVNVSASEIFDPEFETFLASTCQNHGVDPGEITLEITESVVLDSNTRANLLFERLQKQGFKICIDDFGTGYSSLRYLQQFRIDQLKIDRSFVAAPDGEIASEPIVRTLMTLAEAFDLRVVAEGVESQRQRDMLRQAGCRFAQGFYYSPAIPAADLAKMYPEVLGRSRSTPASA